MQTQHMKETAAIRGSSLLPRTASIHWGHISRKTDANAVASKHTRTPAQQHKNKQNANTVTHTAHTRTHTPRLALTYMHANMLVKRQFPQIRPSRSEHLGIPKYLLVFLLILLMLLFP